MRHTQTSLVKIGCLVGLLGACSNNAGTGDSSGSSTTPPQTGTTGTAGSTPTTTTNNGGSGAMTTTGTGASGSSGSTTGSSTTTGGSAGSMETGTAGMTTTTGGNAAPATAGDGFAMCGKPAKDGMCKMTSPGVYALKTEVDVWWRDENNEPTLYDPGRGKITVYFKGEVSNICEDGSGGKAVMKPCGTRLPPLYAEANCGIIQIVFPDQLWDSPMIPTYTTTGSVTGFNPGDVLTVDPTPGLLGIELSDINATFPPYTDTTTFACASGMGASCFPDQDADGNPGVTVEIQQSGMPPAAPYPCAGESLLGPWKYIPAPYSVEAGLTGDGAQTVYIGLRTRLGGSGMIGPDCMSGTGSATAMAFESRSLDCVTSTGDACTPAQSEFVDKNNPSYNVLQAGETPPADWKHPTADADMALDRSPSAGPVSAVVRLGDLGQDFTCEQVRGAAFPAN